MCARPALPPPPPPSPPSPLPFAAACPHACGRCAQSEFERALRTDFDRALRTQASSEWPKYRVSRLAGLTIL